MKSIIFEFCQTLLVLMKFHSFDNLNCINEILMTETHFRAIAHTGDYIHQWKGNRIIFN
jgi:hypothetical protein